jgi:hypothetical protein
MKFSSDKVVRKFKLISTLTEESMSLDKSNISPAQKAIINEARAILNEAFEQASKKIKEIGFGRVAEEAALPCRVDSCACSAFEPGTPFLVCKRGTCRHSLGLHSPI